MINFRSVRSREELENYVFAFEKLKPEAKKIILDDMKAHLAEPLRDIAGELRVPTPEPLRKPRGRRPRTRR